MKGSGTVSAKHTTDGLEVRCSCGETFTLPKDGGERTCDCGILHRYDGEQLLSRPSDRPVEQTTPRRHSMSDPRTQRPSRGESRPL